MGTMFEDDAWEHLMYWMRENRKTAEKINTIIRIFGEMASARE